MARIKPDATTTSNSCSGFEAFGPLIFRKIFDFRICGPNPSLRVSVSVEIEAVTVLRF